MSLFALQLGTFSEFSHLEIEKTFPEETWEHDRFFHLLRTESEKNMEFFQKKFSELGGSIRLLHFLVNAKSMDEVVRVLEKKMKSLAEEGKKMRVGISIFPEKSSKNAFSVLFSDLKKFSKKEGISLRMVNREGKNLDAGTVKKEKLLSDGNFEICLFMGKNGLEIFETIGIQDTFAFIARDTKKPVRDMHVGMLPPKLARMFINFARDEKGNLPTSIYDPFCGTGTVLLEAKSLGCHAQGSDASKEMLEASKKNWKAFFPEEDNIFGHNATKPFPDRVKKSAMVAEGFLGSIFSRPISEFDFLKQKDNLLPLYKKFLEEVANAKIAKLVFGFPCWKGKEKNFSFSNALVLFMKKSGYATEGPIFYRREGQVVGREVWIFTKK